MTTATIFIHGEEVVVVYDYHPSEPKSRSYPGCPSYYEFESINGLDPDDFTLAFVNEIEVALDNEALEEKMNLVRLR